MIISALEKKAIFPRRQTTNTLNFRDIFKTKLHLPTEN